MTYGNDANFVFDVLTFIQTVGIVEEETSSGISTQTSVVDYVVAGEPFTIYFIVQNNGGDFIIAEVELTLEAGEHHITVLGMEKNLTVAE